VRCGLACPSRLGLLSGIGRLPSQRLKSVRPWGPNGQTCVQTASLTAGTPWRRQRESETGRGKRATQVPSPSPSSQDQKERSSRTLRKPNSNKDPPKSSQSSQVRRDATPTTSAPSAEISTAAPAPRPAVRVESYETDIPKHKAHNKTLFEYLPPYARTRKVPSLYFWLSVGMAVPLGLGCIAVHVLPRTSLKGWARDSLNACIHYACALITFQAAVHVGLGLSEFALPPQTKRKWMYNLFRYVYPLWTLCFAVYSSRKMESQTPFEAVITLGAQFITLLAADYYAYEFCIVPPWFYWHRFRINSACVLALVVLSLSEQMATRGRVTRLNM